MTDADPTATLRQLLAGDLTPRTAARRLLAESGGMGAGLVLDPSTLSPEALLRLEQLMPALRWELAKAMLPGQVPDVDYDSPEYHAWRARVPAIQPERRGVARFLPPDAPTPSAGEPL